MRNPRHAKQSGAMAAGMTRLCGVSMAILMLAACSDADRSDPPSAPETGSEVAPATSAADPAVPACGESNGIRTVCGFKNPEDLVVVPGGEFLLVSEMGAFLSDAPGELSLLNVAQEQRHDLPINWELRSDAERRGSDAERWGDQNCSPPTPARLSPHGIDLVTRDDGRHLLLVVNHGDEQVEFFELARNDANWQLHWMGCAKPPGDPFINDVAGLPDGGFVATHMWDKSLPFDEVVARLTAGEAIGWVWQWSSGDGFTKLPGSDDLMPNGIAVSADGSTVFVNIYMGNKTVGINRSSGARESQFIVKNPDNILLGADGKLWLASHLNDPIEGRCEEGHPGPCLLPFQILRADPETMAADVAFTHDGAPMGYVTVALPHAGRVWFGTASGDRLASIAQP